MAVYSDTVNPSEPEEWRAVPGYEGLYEVSDLGRVRSLERMIIRNDRWGGRSPLPVKAKFLKIAPSGVSGHVCVNLCRDGTNNTRLVHHLVLEAFVGPKPAGKECRHLNGYPADNRLANLTWGTRGENMADRTRLGEHNPPMGIERHNAVLNEELVRQIRREKAKGLGGSAIARSMGLNTNTVFGVLTGRNWGWVK